MGDWVGIIIFLAFGLISIVSKAKQEQSGQGKRPAGRQWPGPVAGPGMPGYPKPNWPASPRTQPDGRPRTPAPSVPGLAPAPMPQAAPLSGEGVGSEEGGLGRPGELVERELARFDREADQLERPRLGQFTDDLVRPDGALAPRLPAFGDDLVQPEQDEQVAAQAVERPVAVGGLNQAALQQAVIMAEVLGKPKALQGRRMRRI